MALRWFCAFAWAGLMPVPPVRGAETIPAAPRDHFNDYAGVVSRSVARQLNERLAGFERSNSGQVVVAIFPRMQSDAPVEAYTLRVAQAWGAGRTDRDNGVVLFAFMEEHQLYLQVGTGLEAKIPDPLAKRIIDRELVPRFRSRDFDGGFTAGVDAILAAIRAPSPLPDQTPVEAARPPVPDTTAVQAPAPRAEPSGGAFRPRHSGGPGFPSGLVLLILIVAAIKLARLVGGAGSDDYGPRWRRRSWPLAPLGGGGFGRHSRGGGSSFGGGSFRGGGGGFRGGGAGGKW